MKRKIIAVNAALFALLFGLVAFNKEILRPHLRDLPVAGALVGCLPNFLAAFLISLAPVYPVFARKPKHGRVIVYSFAIFVFAVLTVEEIAPAWGASTHYDPLDIVASGTGSLLAVVVFELIAWKKRSREQ